MHGRRGSGGEGRLSARSTSVPGDAAIAGCSPGASGPQIIVFMLAISTRINISTVMDRLERTSDRGLTSIPRAT